MATGWILREMNPADLKNHPVNIEIYGTQSPDDDMLASVKEFGVLEPIRATKDNLILSGHRRNQHARIAKCKTVPVLVARHALSNAEQVIEIVESNRQREKTREQRAREFGKLAEAKAELARKRQSAAGKARHGQPGENFSEAEKGRAKDQAAAQVGMSRPTAEKALAIVRASDEKEAAGDKEGAAEIRKRLNTEPVSRVHESVVKPSKSKHKHEGNGKLDFDDETIDQHFGKLIRAVDDRAEVLKAKGEKYRQCIADLRAFAQSWKAWRKETRK